MGECEMHIRLKNSVALNANLNTIDKNNSINYIINYEQCKD